MLSPCRCSIRSSATRPSSPIPATSTPSREYRPQDATTNPSLLLKAAQQPQYRPLVDAALQDADRVSGPETARAEAFMDHLAVNFGRRILKIVPGRVSTEVDARLSFDTEGTRRQGAAPHRALRAGRHRARAHPHQGRQHVGGHPRRRAARTRGHSLQPDAAFQLRAGRRVRRSGRHADLAVRRPHLRLVQEGTRGRDSARGGSRRRVRHAHLQLLQEVRLQDAGDGRELPQGRADRAARRLRSADDQPRSARGAAEHAGRADAASDRRRREGERRAEIHLDEKTFRWMHNQDAMAVEKLSEGIRRFYEDARKLEAWAQDGGDGRVR